MSAETTTSPPPIRVRRRLGTIVWVLIGFSVVIGIAVAGALLLIWSYVNNHKNVLQQEIARLRAAGVPTNATELHNAYHNDPDADRGGEELVAVFAEYQIKSEFRDGMEYRKRLAKTGSQLSAEDIAHLRDHLQANERYMDHLRQLTSVPHRIHYPIDLTKGYEVDLSFLRELKNAETMLAAQMQMAAIDGNAEKVVQSLVSSMVLAETLRDAPTLTLQMERSSLHQFVRDQIEFALNACALRAESISALREAVRSIDFDGMTVLGLVGDRACFLDESGNFNSQGGEEYSKSSVGAINIANVYSRYFDLIRIGDLAAWDRAPAAVEFQNKLYALRGAGQFLHYWELIMLPPSANAYTMEVQSIAANEALKAALAIVQFNFDQHALPPSLSALVPKYIQSVPIDPFDGNPLRYSHADSRFLVYSIGWNRIDEGGKPLVNVKTGREGDVVFRVLNVSHLSSN